MTPTATETYDIDVDRIDANPGQPRKKFEGIKELAQSIREHGILQNLVVTPRGDRFLLVAGERRLRAAQQLDLDVVPCTVRDLTDEQVYTLSVAENIARHQMTLFEEADACERLLEIHGDADRVGEMLSRSGSWVTRRAKLTRLTEETRWVVETSDIGVSASEALSWLDEGRQAVMVRRIRDGEVAGDKAIKRAATAMWRNQQQSGLFGDEDPMTVEEQRLAVKHTRDLNKTVDRIAEMLADVLQTDEATLAAAGHASAELAHALDQVAKAASRAAHHVAVARHRNHQHEE